MKIFTSVFTRFVTLPIIAILFSITLISCPNFPYPDDFYGLKDVVSSTELIFDTAYIYPGDGQDYIETNIIGEMDLSELKILLELVYDGKNLKKGKYTEMYGSKVCEKGIFSIEDRLMTIEKTSTPLTSCLGDWYRISYENFGIICLEPLKEWYFPYGKVYLLFKYEKLK